MSGNKQRKVRQRLEREQWQRDQERLAESRRRRHRRVIVLGVAAATVAVAALVLALASRDEPAPGAQPPREEEVELIPEEAAREAQATAAARAMEAGDVLADDYTVAPGTPVSSGLRPAVDDRPVACGGTAPANVRAARPRYPGGPAEVLDPDVDYVATITTSCGTLTIDLLEEEAPAAVNSFVFLAEEGFYDGLELFRDFGGVTAVQGGSGDNTTGWDVGYRLPSELDAAERDGYPVGTVTTAGEGPYTAGSDFYIAYGRSFDAGFETDRNQTTFGRVLTGMDVIDQVTSLERVGMGAESFAERVFMESVTIEER